MRTAAPTKRSRVNAFQRAAATGLELDDARSRRAHSVSARTPRHRRRRDRSSDSRPAPGMARSTRAPGGRRQWPRLRVPARVRDLAGRRGHRRSCAVRRPAVDDSALGRRRQALRTLRARRGERRPFDDRRGRGRLPSGHARRVVLLRRDLARGSRKRARAAPRHVLVPRDDPRRGVSRRRACGSRGGARSTCRTPSSSARATSASSPRASSSSTRSTASTSSASSTSTRVRRRAELDHLALLGPPDRLSDHRPLLDVERVIIAFSEAAHEELLATIRELRKLDVQIDIVPRLFEIVGPKAGIHTFEGLALVGLPPVEDLPLVAAAQAHARLRGRAGDAGRVLAADGC